MVMVNIHTLDDLYKNTKCESEKTKYKYRIARTLAPTFETSMFVKCILQLLDYIFIFYKYLQKPVVNNIITVNEKIDVFNRDKSISCSALLDTGNETITIINRNILFALGYTAKDFNKWYKIHTVGIGGQEYMSTIYIKYSILDFKFEGYVGVGNNYNAIYNKYDVIVGRNDISRMCHSGYTFSI